MKFELIIKHGTSVRETIHRDESFAQLVATLASALLKPGMLGSPDYSGARGEIEVGYSGGDQYLLRVVK